LGFNAIPSSARLFEIFTMILFGSKDGLAESKVACERREWEKEDKDAH
tara:strand:+ start:177 stop:320 length:144 start_codon:yes stop_codon:yes gene_type:complete